MRRRSLDVGSCRAALMPEEAGSAAIVGLAVITWLAAEQAPLYVLAVIMWLAAEQAPLYGPAVIT